jgi:hypothetical protein
MSTELPCNIEEARELTLDLEFLSIAQPNIKRITVLETFIPKEMYLNHTVFKQILVRILLFLF